MKPKLNNDGSIPIPKPVQDVLRAGAALSINISGGKDSQALLRHLAGHPDRSSWTGDVFAHHADLGRSEWFDTPSTVEDQADRSGLPLVISRRTQGDLIDHIGQRRKKLRQDMRYIPPSERQGGQIPTGKVYWPSASQRYCTSDMKRAPIQKYLRRYDLVVIALGIRRYESKARQTKPIVTIETKLTGAAFRDLFPKSRHPRKKRITNADHLRCVTMAVERYLADPSLGRLALRWNGIFRFTEADVWNTLGTTEKDLDRRRNLYDQGLEERAFDGWPAHRAYVRGNERLSCSICVLACNPDMVNGARYNPEAAFDLLELELAGGKTIKQYTSMAEIMEEAGLLLPVIQPD